MCNADAGGGNYLEKETLLAWAAGSSSRAGAVSGITGSLSQSTAPPTTRHVVYGCTEVLSGDEFLGQLEELGVKSGITPTPAPTPAGGPGS